MIKSLRVNSVKKEYFSMNKKKILIIFLLIVVMGINMTIIYASSWKDVETGWWNKANLFLSDFNGNQTKIGASDVGSILKFLDPIVNLARLVGNMIFVAVTVLLGVKYIWGRSRI